MDQVRPRHVIIAAVLVLALILIVKFWRSAFGEVPLAEPQLVVNEQNRAVIDLLAPPRQALIGQGGETQDLPGRPRRYLVIVVAEGVVQAGWTSAIDGRPEDPLDLGRAGNRLLAFFDRQSGDAVRIQILRGWVQEDGMREILIRIVR